MALVHVLEAVAGVESEIEHQHPLLHRSSLEVEAQEAHGADESCEHAPGVRLPEAGQSDGMDFLEELLLLRLCGRRERRGRKGYQGR
jgi:hypothetical protein